MYLHISQLIVIVIIVSGAYTNVVASPLNEQIDQIQNISKDDNSKLPDMVLQDRNLRSSRPTHAEHSSWITVDILVTGSSASVAKKLHTLGAKNIVVSPSLISARISASIVDQLQQIDEVGQIRKYRGFTRNGSVQSQGVKAMQLMNVNDHFGARGKGVKIGVMSDSYNCHDGEQADIESGDLPLNVHVVREIDDCTFGTDEGRALIQVMYDIAPDAQYYFHTGFETGMAGNAHAIHNLANKYKVHIIIDDFASYYETFFQDDLTTQAIDQVTEKGVVYVTAAGNAGSNSYEQAFRLVVDPVLALKAHDFDPGPEIDIFQPVTIPPGESLSLILQWDQPSHSVSGPPGSMTDLDIFLIDSAKQEVVTSAATNNLGNDPIEVLDYQNYTGNEKFHLLITLAAGEKPNLIKYIIPTKFLGSIDKYHTVSSTIAGHSNAAGAITVGAALYARTFAYGHPRIDVEPFSSVGGTPVIFDRNGIRKPTFAIVRPKPDITAPNGVNTTFYQGDDLDADGLPNFRGTSAAAPHVAALAALILEVNPDLEPEHVRHILQATAQDILTSYHHFLPKGFDFSSGFGLVHGDKAITLAKQMDSRKNAIALEPDRLYALPDADATSQLNSNRYSIGPQIHAGSVSMVIMYLLLSTILARPLYKTSRHVILKMEG